MTDALERLVLRHYEILCFFAFLSCSLKIHWMVVLNVCGITLSKLEIIE